MRVNVYTIYDVVADECGPIFQAKNDTVALRCFMSLFSKLFVKFIDSRDRRWHNHRMYGRRNSLGF